MSSSIKRRIIISSHEHEVHLETSFNKSHITVEFDGVPFEIFLGQTSDVGQTVLIDGMPYIVDSESSWGGRHLVTVEGKVIPVSVRRLDEAGPTLVVPQILPRTRGTGSVLRMGRVSAHMSGRITLVKVKPLERVREGDPMFILVAMKMENTIVAPRSGVVVEVRVKVGSNVNRGDLLATIE